MSQAIHSANEARHQLYEMMKRDASFEQRTEEALELGRAYLDVEVVDQAHEMSPELTVETALWELVENAARCAGDASRADITLTAADDGPGLSDSEQDVLQAGIETQLVHGSGRGLWSVYWVAANHHGELALDTSEGTPITLTPPGQLAQTVTDSGSDPQIERADERYETAFEAAPTGLVVLGGGGEVLEANDRAESLLDCEDSPYAGRPITAVTDAATGPLAEGRLAAGEGRIEEADQTLDYRLATDVGSGQRLLVVEAKR